MNLSLDTTEEMQVKMLLLMRC